MAPDINSLPPSPYRSQATSSTPRRPSEPRRLSERMASPSSSNIVPSTPPPRSPTSSSTTFNAPPPREDNTGVDPGPGPLRHPRPLTAADLHMQLEKEQEAVVNRLTRELTALRAQTASTTSNTSSTSASTGIPDSAAQTEGSVFLNSSIHPTSSRRHRSSSNLSSRGGGSAASNAATAGSTGTVNTTTGLVAGSGIAPPRDSSYSYNRSGGDPLSRQSSVASRRSDASSPSLSSSLLYTGAEQHTPSHHRHSHSNSLSTPGASGAGGVRGGNYVPSTHRYDEAALAKAELEMVKAENEALKGRVRELERMARRNSAGGGGEREGEEGESA